MPTRSNRSTAGFPWSRVAFMVASLLFVFAAAAGWQVGAPAVFALDDGLARTPPMGWNSWNCFGTRINEAIIRQIADAMVSSGMKDAGYEYVVIDDCWMAPVRDAQGRLQANPATFPSGIKALADYVHSKGLKLGIYSSNGLRTCQGLPASLGYEEVDAQTFAEWGVDYLKYDFCYSEMADCEIDKIAVAGVEYEAESPANEISGGARIRYSSVCSGKRTVMGIGEGSGSLQFNNIEVPSDGQYELTITYVHTTNPANPRAVFISINGGPGERLRLINPGGQRSAINTLTIPVTLKSGKNTIKFYNPYTTREITVQNYKKMSEALRATGRPIVFSICEWGTHSPWLWGAQVGHLWRTTGDIQDNWGSVLNILDRQVGLEQYAGPGHWNDPDMLEVGNGGMSETEYQAHFSLWCILAAPLMAGNDLRSMSEATRAILTNREVIAVNQDPLGVQGRKIRDDGDHEIWVKPLVNGERAVLFFNRGEMPARMAVPVEEVEEAVLQLLAEVGRAGEAGQAGQAGAAAARGKVSGEPAAEDRVYVVRDLWSHRDFTVAREMVAFVPAHGVAMFRVRRGAPGEAPPALLLTIEPRPGAAGATYVPAGETRTVTVTVVNYGPVSARDLRLELALPPGWSARPLSCCGSQVAGADTPAPAARLAVVPPGESGAIDWEITSPAGAPVGTVTVPIRAVYRYDAGPAPRAAGPSSVGPGSVAGSAAGTSSGSAAGSPSPAAPASAAAGDAATGSGLALAQQEVMTVLVVPPPAPVQTSYLSDLEWVSTTNGWGPVERDRSNGETGPTDGRPIRIGGQAYARGLGVHAPSRVTYYLGGRCSTFRAVVGVDDEVGDQGSVVFQVWADGVKVYDSGMITGRLPGREVEVDIRGVEELTLVVTDGGDNKDFDHADWANAEVII